MIWRLCGVACGGPQAARAAEPRILTPRGGDGANFEPWMGFWGPTQHHRRSLEPKGSIPSSYSTCVGYIPNCWRTHCKAHGQATIRHQHLQLSSFPEI